MLLTWIKLIEGLDVFPTSASDGERQPKQQTLVRPTAGAKIKDQADSFVLMTSSRSTPLITSFLQIILSILAYRVNRNLPFRLSVMWSNAAMR